MFIKNAKGQWWELDESSLTVYNFWGGHHSITEEELQHSEKVECAGWRQLYLIKGYCPLVVDVKWPEVWISPNGKYYIGQSHENRAEEILEILYGSDDVHWAGDTLEELGWIRASRNLMWEVRLSSSYWNDKKVTQKQFDALYDWCKYHNKQFPEGGRLITT